LQLYNQLLQIEYSPITALNRTYALSKVFGEEKAIKEALKLDLMENHFYHSLLGNLNTNLDNKKAIFHFEMAYKLAKSNTDKMTIKNHLKKLK
jgi:RNA polymerase sigma-70 factor (ECF subfamily)